MWLQIDNNGVVASYSDNKIASDTLTQVKFAPSEEEKALMKQNYAMYYNTETKEIIFVKPKHLEQEELRVELDKLKDDLREKVKNDQLTNEDIKIFIKTFLYGNTGV